MMIKVRNILSFFLFTSNITLYLLIITGNEEFETNGFFIGKIQWPFIHFEKTRITHLFFCVYLYCILTGDHDLNNKK